MYPPGLQRFARSARGTLGRVPFPLRPTACAEPTTGPRTVATPCMSFPSAAVRHLRRVTPMRRVLGFLAGVLVGQWLVFGGALSPADLQIRAAAAGLKAAPGREAIELQTLGGRTRGPSAIVASVQVGDALLRDVPVVLHDPGPGVDGILGNTFLGHYQVTVDAGRRQLALRAP